MHSPIELIRTGLINQDWSSVARGYQLLTGEEIVVEPTQPQETVDGRYVELLDKLCALVDEENERLGVHQVVLQPEPDWSGSVDTGRMDNSNSYIVDTTQPPAVEELQEELVSTQEVVPNDPFAKFRVEPTNQENTGKGRAPNKPNRFHDDLTISAGEDIAFSKKFSSSANRKDYRPPPREVEAVCDKCGKKEKVPQLLGPRDDDGEKTIFLCQRCLRG